ncbi:MAG: sigma-70 family RNA polymerase sigma factor [Sphingobacteriia bacterium]|nr:MAG: sigma-70 family RNA polymerase sigma factor [Sphingobacteriia bacterium]
MTELDLLSACLENNPVLGVCYRYAHSKEDAEDMLQEGFIKVFTQIQSFQHKGAFEGWVRKIMVHTCINFLKKNKKFQEQVALENAGALEMREETLPSLMQARQIVECIRLLPMGYRTVLNLYALEGYSHKEIGHMLDIEESTSRSQYTRAKVMLEQILVKKKIIEQPEQGLSLLAAWKK